MEVDQKESQTTDGDSQPGYHCNNSGSAKGLRYSSNKGRVEKLRIVAVQHGGTWQ